jgi:ABC-2 type transport system ATP-binding protein
MEIEICSYNKTIKGTPILTDINLTFTSGHIYGLSGTNGSGKTMLMRAICGLIKPTSGCVRLDGKELGADYEFLPNTGTLLENPVFLQQYTGKENLQILASIRNVIKGKDIDAVLTNIGLDPEDKRKYKKYSLGMKQRLGIAAAIMENPDVVILDEPFNALDRSGCDLTESIIKELKVENKIVILACHEFYRLESLCDEIFVIENGKIIPEKESVS